MILVSRDPRRLDARRGEDQEAVRLLVHGAAEFSGGGGVRSVRIPGNVRNLAVVLGDGVVRKPFESRLEIQRQIQRQIRRLIRLKKWLQKFRDRDSMMLSQISQKI